MARYHNLVAFLCFALLITNSQSTPQANDFSFCSWCEDFVGALDKEIESGAGTVEQQVTRACDAVLPHSLQPFCINTVDGLIDGIVKSLEQEIPPKAICEEIDLCQPSRIGV
uniref:Saposin B-type domain-containing protein n=1 Tax=Panagrellus redivivus TaxID=6233 RepID=A0A7E5A193_PANRE